MTGRPPGLARISAAMSLVCTISCSVSMAAAHRETLAPAAAATPDTTAPDSCRHMSRGRAAAIGAISGGVSMWLMYTALRIAWPDDPRSRWHNRRLILYTTAGVAVADAILLPLAPCARTPADSSRARKAEHDDAPDTSAAAHSTTEYNRSGWNRGHIPGPSTRSFRDDRVVAVKVSVW